MAGGHFLAGSGFNLLSRSGVTVTVSPVADTLFPVGNLFDGLPGVAYAFSADATDATITSDHGSAKAANASILLGHNFKGTTITGVEWRTGSADDGVTFDQLQATHTFRSITHPDGTTEYVEGSSYKLLSASVTKRFWRWIFKGANGGTKVMVGELVLGLAAALLKSPKLPLESTGRAIQTRITTELLQTHVNRLSRWPSHTVNLTFLGLRSQLEQQIDSLYQATAAGVSPVAIIPDDSLPELHYGRVAGSFPRTMLPSANAWTWELPLEEDPFFLDTP